MNEDSLLMWKAAIDLMAEVSERLPPIWPEELPPETTPEFWFRVAQLEMQTRDSVSAALRRLANGAGLPALSPLEAWMVRRRFEWGAQVAWAKAKEGAIPQDSASDVLEWLLVTTWETNGCLGLWQHAERGGQAHPENPEGPGPR